MTNITGKIYQQTNDDGTENRFPKTVVPAVIGLSQYLQDQFNTLSDLYMPKEGESESKTGQEITYRKSEATINAKTVTIDRIYGKSLAWNQLIKNGNFASTLNWSADGASLSASGNVLTWSPSGGTSYYNLSQEVAFVNGHIYYVCAYVKGSEANSLDGAVGNAAGGGGISWGGNTISTSWKKFSGIGRPTGATNFRLYLRPNSSSISNYTAYFKDIIMVDLTLMFGATIASTMTTKQFEDLYLPKYYATNEGQLISNDASAIKAVGFNIFDEEYLPGCYNYYSTNAPYSQDSIQICTKNHIPVIPGATYFIHAGSSNYTNGYLCYDANNNYLTHIDYSNNSNIVIPSDTYYIKINFGSTYGNAYNHDICINLSDPSKNGTYEPYRKSTMQLGLNNFKVKSHNIWDEEWRNGYYNDNGELVSNAGWVCNKNLIPVFENTIYYIKAPKSCRLLAYDANGVFLQAIGYYSNNEFTTPSGTHFINFHILNTYGNVYNNDICINVSSSFNGQYEPHGILTIDGLKGSGTWRDELFANKYIKKALRCNMGDWSWNISSTTTEYYAQPRIPNRIVNNSIAYVCSKYTTGNNDSYQYLQIQNTNGGEYRVRDKKYWNGGSSIAVDAATFKSDMNGVMIDVELATPIEYELAEPLTYTFKAGTTEERISPNSDGLSAPFCCDLTYNASETAGVLDALQGLSRKLELIEERLARLEDNG